MIPNLRSVGEPTGRSTAVRVQYGTVPRERLVNTDAAKYKDFEYFITFYFI